MDRDSLALLLAQGVSVEAIARRFRKHPSTIAYWMKKFDLVAPNRERHAARGGIAEHRLRELVDGGLSVTEIASEVGLSKTTVRHWLRRYDLLTKATLQARAGKVAREAGQATATFTCAMHGETAFVLEASGYYRCKRCRVERVAERRRRTKGVLVEEAGGRCAICGYDRYVGALEFHHVDPALKRLQISNGVTISLDVLREEIKKCVLLCSNCHAEVEGGRAALPLEFLRQRDPEDMS